jgi:hypothetical protein
VGAPAAILVGTAAKTLGRTSPPTATRATHSPGSLERSLLPAMARR